MLNIDPARMAPVSFGSRSSSPVLRRAARPLLAVALLLGVCWLVFFRGPVSSTSAVAGSTSSSKSTASRLWPGKNSAPKPPADPVDADAVRAYMKGHEQFWYDVADFLARHKPAFDGFDFNGATGWLQYEPDEPPITQPDLVTVSDDELRLLRLSHAGALADARRLGAKLPYRKGTRGIVTSANNDALTILSASLRVLRKAGSRMPVEVMVDNYEEKACDVILPSLGARCIFVTDVVAEPVPEQLRFNHFGFKAAVMAFSSFEEVLYMDADLLATDRPEDLFEQEPYVNEGLVLWPDYWRNTASHYFYKVLGINMPDMMERSSTESGAILLNKRTHAAVVLQALYYNIFGPRYYYPLITQGAPGEGDKDTWMPAAKVLNLPFYQVTEPPARIGYVCNDKDRPIASGQHHPGDDYALIKVGATTRKRPFMTGAPTPRILFVHGNLPKYDGPALLSFNLAHIEWKDVLWCANDSAPETSRANDPHDEDKVPGDAHRLWGPKEVTEARFGWDVEKALWDSMRWVACAHEHDFMLWNEGNGFRSPPRKNVCAGVTAFWELLFKGEEYDEGMAPIRHTERPSTGWAYWS